MTNQLILINGGNAYAFDCGHFITAPVMADGTVNTVMNEDNWHLVDYDRISEEEAEACRAIEAQLGAMQTIISYKLNATHTNIMVNREEA